MADATTATERDGRGDSPVEPVVEHTTIDVLLGVWAALYALYALGLVIRLFERFVDPSPAEVVLGAAFALALAALLFVAAADRLPAGGYFLVGATEVFASFGLLRGWAGLSFRSGAAEAATSGLLLANLAVATILLVRGVRRVRAGEPLVPAALRGA